MTQRMAPKGVKRKESGVENHDDGSKTDAEMSRTLFIRKPHTLPSVIAQQNNEQCREIEKITVNILDDEREVAFAQISFARFAHGAVDRVSPKRFVVSAAIIVTGETKTGGNPKNQEARRKRQPVWQPSRFAVTN